MSAQLDDSITLLNKEIEFAMQWDRGGKTC